MCISDEESQHEWELHVISEGDVNATSATKGLTTSQVVVPQKRPDGSYPTITIARNNDGRSNAAEYSCLTTSIHDESGSTLGILLADSTISRKHLTLSLPTRGSGADLPTITDLGSTNGTRLLDITKVTSLSSTERQSIVDGKGNEIDVIVKFESPRNTWPTQRIKPYLKVPVPPGVPWWVGKVAVVLNRQMPNSSGVLEAGVRELTQTQPFACGVSWFFPGEEVIETEQECPKPSAEVETASPRNKRSPVSCPLLRRRRSSAVLGAPGYGMKNSKSRLQPSNSSGPLVKTREDRAAATSGQEGSTNTSSKTSCHTQKRKQCPRGSVQKKAKAMVKQPKRKAPPVIPSLSSTSTTAGRGTECKNKMREAQKPRTPLPPIHKTRKYPKSVD